MNDDAFAKLVAEEVKNRATRDSRAFLLRSDNWDRWQKALLALIENLDIQIENIDYDIEADTERYTKIEGGSILLSEALANYELRKKKIQRFRFHVENRLNQVNKMIETGVEIEDDALTTLVTLQKAIRRHKEMMYEYDLEDTPIDRALWASLEGRWEFEKITPEDIK
jgi:hypothetical protein